MAKIKSCGFLIFKNDPRNDDPNPSFLLMRHPNRWDLPKGHVDPGETNMECALRELEEETGITRDDIEIDPDFKFKLKYSVRYKRNNGDSQKKKLIIYIAHLVNDVKICLTEHDGYEWIEWNPPHLIQQKTIDPLLKEVADYFSEQKKFAS